MRIDQLTYLTDIAQTGSITTTAQRVFLSQQAVSESIRSLERELGCELLNRSKTGVTLTQRGQLVVEYADTILQNYHALLNDLNSLDEIIPFIGQISIASSPMVTQTIIPGMERYINKFHPDFELRIWNCSNSAVIEHISERAVDLGFFYYSSAEALQLNEVLEHYPSLCFHKLFSNRLVYCTRKDSSRINHTESENGLSENGLTIYFSPNYISTEKYSLKTPISSDAQYKSILISEDIDFIRELILRYDAVCAMPELTYRFFFNYREFSAVPFHEDFTDDLYCVYNADCYESYYDIVISTVKQEIRNMLRKKLEY